MEDPESYDRRSEKKKQKYGTKLRIRRQFPVCMKNRMCYYIVHAIDVFQWLCVTCMQCAKQTERSALCGYYACEYLRSCGSYNHSWRQLKKSIGWWRRSRVDNTTISQTVSDICKFVTNECCHVGEKCFYANSELVTDCEATQLENRHQHERLQVARTQLGAPSFCNHVNMYWCEFMKYYVDQHMNGCNICVYPS